MYKELFAWGGHLVLQFILFMNANKMDDKKEVLVYNKKKWFRKYDRINGHNQIEKGQNAQDY